MLVKIQELKHLIFSRLVFSLLLLRVLQVYIPEMIKANLIRTTHNIVAMRGINPILMRN